MLPHENRLRRPAEFRSVIAAGRRVRRGALVVHLVEDSDDAARVVPIVGFVVGRSVGSSVVRHQVSRRLRAQMAERLPGLPRTSATVIRALPGLGEVDSATIGRELDAAFNRLLASPNRAVAR